MGLACGCFWLKLLPVVEKEVDLGDGTLSDCGLGLKALYCFLSFVAMPILLFFFNTTYNENEYGWI